jgi:hypothetical protein
VTDALLRRLIRLSTDRGLAGEGGLWFALAASTWLMRRARRRRGGVISRVPIEVGDRLVISLRGPGPGDPPA